MKFAIQAGNPQTNEPNIFESSLSEAIETVFPLYTENAFLCWNHIYIPLSYKYDLSYMINDILIMLDKIMSDETGCLTIHWLPDTFRCDWQVKWNSNELVVESNWECTVGDLEKLLNESGSITLPKDVFINEWKRILENLISGLKAHGYTPNILPEMNYLISIKNLIKGPGIYYQS